MTAINHDMMIQASVDTIYNALTTSDGLRGWFTSQVDGSGKIGTHWILKFDDHPTFNWRILLSENSQRVAWQCVEGPGNATGTEVEFTLKPISNNQTQFTITHRGWSKNDPKFERCVDIWPSMEQPPFL